MEILCFFAGMVFVCTKNPLALLFLLGILIFRPRSSWGLWFIAAIVWGSCHQWWLKPRGMPTDDIVLPHATLEGYIASIPTETADKTEFEFAVYRLNQHSVKAQLLLACYTNCPHFLVGQDWQLKAKLHKPHNLNNPGGHDFVQKLASRHIYWTGYIQRGTLHLKKDHSKSYAVLALRQRMAEQLATMSLDEKSLGILQALALGVTTHVDTLLWDLFRRTGTTHLMVISGAHIGLVSGLTYGFFRWLWCFLGRVCLIVPAARAASIAALLAALSYSLLAGFGVPAERSLLSCFFMLLRYFCSQRFGGFQAWRYALLIVLIIEPHTVQSPGFYLSFIAVAILILVHHRFLQTGIKKTLLVQLGCLLGLMPLTIYWFSYGALNGFFANLVAIPWVGFIVVPLSLCTALVSQWVTLPWLLSLLQHAISYLLYYLNWVDSFATINFNYTMPHILSPIALMVAMSLLLFMPLRQLFPATFVLIFASVFHMTNRIKPHEVRVDVLDVGQGLAIAVHTAHHTLIYDTGMKFYRGTDMGKLVIIPYLKALGIHALDKVIISHPDLDHRGGLSSLEAHYDIGELIVDSPTFYKKGRSCHDYQDWIWDGVLFHFFSINDTLKSKNNMSCVLQISNQMGSILFTGDIEKYAEDYLVQHYGKQLKSTVLIVPHHGSKTSSSAPFLRSVAPKYAIVSYGFDNRYHFPHDIVMMAYHKKNIPIYNTVQCGMVSLMLKKQQVLPPSSYLHVLSLNTHP